LWIVAFEEWLKKKSTFEVEQGMDRWHTVIENILCGVSKHSFCFQSFHWGGWFGFVSVCLPMPA
jgi:hypothetical protein